MSGEQWRATPGDEDPNRGFKLTLVGIAAAHLVLLAGLLLAAMLQSKKQVDTVVWMNPGSFGGDSVLAESQATPDGGPQTAPSEPSQPEEEQNTEPETNGEAPLPTPPIRSADPTAHSLGAAFSPAI